MVEDYTLFSRIEHRAGSVEFGPKMTHPEKIKSVKSWPITDHFKFQFCQVLVYMGYGLFGSVYSGSHIDKKKKTHTHID
jgi:hypothetical protein